MRRINNHGLGIRAEFALPKPERTKIADIVHDVLPREPVYESELNMDNRNIKGPFSDPVSIDSIEINPTITEDDYLTRLAIADPLKNFLYDGVDLERVQSEYSGSHCHGNFNVIQGRSVMR